MNSFNLGAVRDELEDSAAALPRVDDLDHGPDPKRAGVAEGMAVGPRAGVDAHQADGPMGDHAIQDLPANEGPAEGHTAEGHVCQASGAMTSHEGFEHVAWHCILPTRTLARK